MSKRSSIEDFKKKERSARKLAKELAVAKSEFNAAIVEAAAVLVETGRSNYWYIDSTLRITLWKNPKDGKRTVIPVC